MLGIAFREEYLRIAFTPPSLRDRWTERVRIFLDILGRHKGWWTLVRPDPVSEEDLLLVHTQEYISFVKRMSELGGGYLDYGDTPAYPGVFDDARLAVGGSAALARAILEGRLVRGFNPQGGFHHAKRGSAGGFCVFNDVALAAEMARLRGLKVAVVDQDGHHGDGTQAILYDKPVLKISFHRYGGWFYPGTGDVNELGEGEGRGYSVNIPLPAGAGDDLFIMALEEVVIPLLNRFGPQFIVFQMGADGHEGDPLVGLRLTTLSYRRIAEAVRQAAAAYAGGRVLGMAGGGYVPTTAAKVWAAQLMVLEGTQPPQELLDEEEGTETTGEVGEFVRKLDFLKERLL